MIVVVGEEVVSASMSSIAARKMSLRFVAAGVELGGGRLRRRLAALK